MDYTKEEKLIGHIIQMMKAKAMSEAKHQITKRSAHAKTLAVLKGYLKIESKLPASLKTELFKEGAFIQRLFAFLILVSRIRKTLKRM